MRVYISGGITGIDDYMERFDEAEKRLTEQKYTVINPAKVNAQLPEGLFHEDYMAVSIAMLSLADAIYMLAGWRFSKGANREYGYALAKGLKIMYEVAENEVRDNGN